MTAFQHAADVVIVGSGAAALSTALAARERGLSPLIIESTALLGGNSAISGGGVWIPNNRVMKRAGQSDNHEDARTNLDTGGHETYGHLQSA